MTNPTEKLLRTIGSEDPWIFETEEVRTNVDYVILLPSDVELIPADQRPPLLREKKGRGFIARIKRDDLS